MLSAQRRSLGAIDTLSVPVLLPLRLLASVLSVRRVLGPDGHGSRVLVPVVGNLPEEERGVLAVSGDLVVLGKFDPLITGLVHMLLEELAPWVGPLKLAVHRTHADGIVDLIPGCLGVKKVRPLDVDLLEKLGEAEVPVGRGEVIEQLTSEGLD